MPTLSLGEFYATENDLKTDVLAYLDYHPQVQWAERFNTGAHRIPGQGNRRPRFIRYAFVGCADILGQLITGHLLVVETKKKPRKATEEQAAFIELVNLGGGLGILAYSLDDVIVALNDFLRVLHASPASGEVLHRSNACRRVLFPHRFS